MRIHGQRWEYRVGNSVVLVDNAFSWIGWTQERLIVNTATVGSATGWFGYYRSFSEPWLTRVGESELRATLKSRLMGIACAVTVDDEPIDPEALWVATWTGRGGTWPDESAWSEAPARSWIAK